MTRDISSHQIVLSDQSLANNQQQHTSNESSDGSSTCNQQQHHQENSPRQQEQQHVSIVNSCQSEQSWIALTPRDSSEHNHHWNSNNNNTPPCVQSVLVDEKKEEMELEDVCGSFIGNQKEKQSMNEELKDICQEMKGIGISPSALQLELAEKGECLQDVGLISQVSVFGISWYYKRTRLQFCYKCCLLSTPLLCLCWSTILLLTLFFVACFGYYSHMPIDGTGSCATLYYSENVFGPIVTMADLNLEKEKLFFSSLDFMNSTTTSDNLPINYYNTLMTHNSYHRRGMMASFIPSMNYEHDSLTNQLNRNVRGLELDIHLNRRTERFQVYHIPLIDDKSNCNCFLSCLLEIKNWMTTNTKNNDKPDLITIFIEPKYARDFVPFCRKEDTHTLPNLMNEILRVFSPEQILTPAKLKGEYSSLRTSVSGRGWPLKNSVKGMVLFVLNLWDENDECKYLLRNEKSFYSNNVTSMDLIFYREYWNNMASAKSDSVFFEVDDARVFMNTSAVEPMLVSNALLDQNTLYVEDPSYIISSPVTKAVQRGYMIRCTAGAVTELRARISMAKKKNPNLKLKDLSKTEACLRSGAQLLNTDYPYADLFLSLFTNQTFQNPLFSNNNNG